ncbi:MAG: hypothetical protein ACRDJO_12355 [Actinomycetota bacterium]
MTDDLDPRPPSRARAGMALLLVSALLAATGTVSLYAFLRSGNDEPQLPTVDGPEVPGGFRRVGGPLFSLGVPDAWSAVPLTGEKIEELLERTELDPAMEELVGGLGDNAVLFAYDPDDPASNLSVLRRSSSGTTPQAVREQATALLGTEVDATDLESEIVSLPAGTAVRIGFVNHQEVDGRRVDIGQTQYHVFAGPWIYVLTVSGEGLGARDVATVARSIDVEARSVTSA